MSSFSLVRGFTDRLAATPGRTLKVAHGGVLDPFATGLVLVLVGSTTRLFELLHDVPKRYVATVAWGSETDSGDGGGRVVTTADAAALTADQCTAALAPFLGWTEQVPPSTSNKRVDGERAYERAWRGEEVSLPAVKVFLHSARFLSHDLPRTSVLELSCRGGFYVRSMVRDLGRALGARAHVAALERTSIGPMETLPAGEEAQVPPDDVLSWLPTRVITDEEWGQLRREQPIHANAREWKPPRWPMPTGFAPAPRAMIRAQHLGKLVALLERTGVEQLSLVTVLPGL